MTTVEMGMVTIAMVKRIVEALEAIARALASLASDVEFFRVNWRFG